MVEVEAPRQAGQGVHIPRYSADRPRANEWYTPRAVVEAARAVMGGIDLDPASCAMAQESVQAARWYGEAEDGLSLPWIGRMWLNPPYSSKGAYALNVWTSRLVEEFRHANVTEAIMLINNVPDSKAGAAALAASSAACFTCPRLKFLRPGQPPANPPVGQMVLLYSRRQEAVRSFGKEFARFGTVVAPWRAMP